MTPGLDPGAPFSPERKDSQRSRIAIFSIDRPSSVKYGTLCNHELLQHHDASSRRRHMPCIAMHSHASYDLLFGRFEASDDDALGRFEVEAVMW